MQLSEWNEILLAWFFSEQPHQRVYLRVDDGELTRLNVELGLGLDRPADNLVAAVRQEVQGSPLLGWLRRQGDAWSSRASPAEAPPWLGVLALSVLVVARETERGSLAFYPPFSNELGLRGVLTQEDYEVTLYKWWLDLAVWLTDVNAGRRGLPSWRHIPQAGPRCVIGHPYTQILLRREDLRDLEAFLGSIGRLGPGDLEVIDPARAGSDLLIRLRRWAAQHKVSGRLWEILHGSRKDASDSLQYMLLDRLLDEVEIDGARSAEREIPLVVSLDDWSDRRLRFSALLRSSGAGFPPPALELGGQHVGPLAAGEPQVTRIEVDAAALDAGVNLSVDGDVSVVYRPREVLALAARDWAVWCSVDDAEAGETIYLLVADRATARLRQLLADFPPSGIEGVPSGWQLYGPSKLESADGLDALGVPVRRASQAVPSLVGGLEVARRSYLLGGPPAVIVPAGRSETSLRVDGRPLDIPARADMTVDLGSLGLGEGAHHVDVGPYRLSFELHAVHQLPVVAESVGRTRLGAIVPLAGMRSEPVFIGAARRPPAEYDPVVLTPLGDRMVALGLPGDAAECSPTMGPWAADAGIPQLVFEPAQSSSYPGGRRPVHPLRWMAVQGHRGGAWSVTQVQRAPGADQGDAQATVSPLAREVISEIGTVPTVLKDGQPDDREPTRSEWAAYARAIVADR